MADGGLPDATAASAVSEWRILLNWHIQAAENIFGGRRRASPPHWPGMKSVGLAPEGLFDRPVSLSLFSAANLNRSPISRDSSAEDERREHACQLSNSQASARLTRIKLPLTI